LSSVPPVDGVVLLDKPIGITSNAAIQRVKRLFGAAKAGHVGTLDPLASGLLPVCMGEATKFSTDAFGADKTYEAELLLGVTTATGDTEGEVLTRLPVAVTCGQVLAVLRRFTGLLSQVPPMYSALKRDGKPLYAYARAGQTVERVPRSITIHDIALLGMAAERVRISVRCSKGTYIRVLAEDIGRDLGCGATLAGLRRTTLGVFEIRQAVALDELEGAAAAQKMAFLLPVDSLVSGLPVLTLTADVAARMLKGQSVQPVVGGSQGVFRLYDVHGRFLGLGELQPGKRLVPKRLIAESAAGNMLGACVQASKIA
jgi:tRNA pseudouridine55 synthase